MLFTELITFISSLFIKVSPDYLCCNMNFGFDTYLKKHASRKALKIFSEKLFTKKRLFLKPGTKERGTECGECEERGECSLGFRGISQRIPGNVIILTFGEMLKKILGNAQKYFREC